MDTHPEGMGDVDVRIELTIVGIHTVLKPELNQLRQMKTKTGI
jgi:hypothetical protein